MLWIWLGFIVLILILLALDLGVFHRKAHVVSVKEALGWSVVWITLALLFTFFVYYGYENHWLGLGSKPDPLDKRINDGPAAVWKYLTGYVVEKSLSVDNIFVIAIIFRFFVVPAIYQHRVLFWGILGALLMRGAMIGIGAALIERFHWILYVFGGLLIVTAIKMLLMKSDHVDPGDNYVIKLTRRFFPVTDQYHDKHFVIKDKAGRTVLTPLMLALIVVETTDLIFAVDSIPAIFAITADPFLVFTSNVFAILGLRSLYFALAGMMDKFRYLKVALAIVLAVVGIKMLTHSWLKQLLGDEFNFYLLGLIMLILGGGVVASIIADRRRPSAPSGSSDAPGRELPT
jgi:tellurite resistance protein TerC